MNKLEKKILTLWRAEAFLLILLIIAPILFVPALLIPQLSQISWIALLMILAVSGFAVFYTSKKYSNWGYEMKEDHLHLEYGVFKKVNSMAPYVRIQHIDTQRGPVERLAGLSSLVVYTAGSRGADLKIPGLKPEDAERMQEKLRDVAIESEDRDAV